jgi:hypothetical protein
MPPAAEDDARKETKDDEKVESAPLEESDIAELTRIVSCKQLH